MNQKKKVIEIYWLLFADLCSIIIAYSIAILLRYTKFKWVMDPDVHFMGCIGLLLFCTLFSFLIEWNRKFMERGLLVELGLVIRFNILLILATSGSLFAMKRSDDFSRLVMGYFIILNIIIQWLAHLLLKKLLRTYYLAENNRVKLMVVANAAVLEETVNRLSKNMELDYEIVALACLDSDKYHEISGIPVSSGKEGLMEMARQIPLDEVFLYIPGEDKEYVEEIIHNFESMGIICHYNIEIVSKQFYEIKVGTFCNYSVVTYSMYHIDYRRRMIKRFMDILGGLVGLLITAVFLPFVALAIKLESRGPVFFSQVRIGKNGRRFKIYKFRSMYLDAEERKKELEAQNEMQGLMFKMKKDPRITKVGKFLRKTSIDELPQFFNILRGDMSLVGTRPPTEDEFEKYNLYYRRRISMTPGLTGLWQVSGRSEIEDFDDVVRYDLEYIDKWSIGVDVKILLKTIAVVLFGRGAK